MREKAVRCFSSAAEFMKGPDGYFTSPAFSNLRWSLAGEQRDERMRLFTRKLLRRLDQMNIPFYAAGGLIDLKTARHRFVTGLDPWEPMNNPYLDGTAARFEHCIHGKSLDRRSWWLFAEIAFDVARLAQTPVMWGGFSDWCEPGLWAIYPGATPDGWRVDRRTYGSKRNYDLPWELEGPDD